MHEHKLAVQRLDPKSEVATHAAQMGHIFNFDAVEIVGRGGDHTTRQVQEAWMSTDRSVNRRINLPPPYLTLRTFLAGDSHGAGQSGPSVISAADGGDSGHGDIRELLSEFHALHFVEELNFAGNPLAYDPFYRETILARFPRLVKFDDVAVYAISGRRRPVREKTKYEPRRKSKSLVPRRGKQKAPRVSERSQAVQTPKSCLRKLADLQEAEFPVAKVDDTWEIHSQ
ncbi:hypothetical protein SprV_0100025000 [Sparganum proliferum]